MGFFHRVKQSIRKNPADWGIPVLLVLLAVLCHSRYLLTPGLLFATEGDSFRQILPTSILYQNALANGDPFWSWSFGLGGDLFTELSYAGTTSVFTYLQFFVRWLFGAAGGSDLYVALAWKLGFSIFKQALALGLTYALLRKEKTRPAYALIGAVAYGCAPWFLYRAILFDFMTDSYVWLPLVMLLYNRYRKTGKWTLLSISIALMIGNNFYFGYICCVFFASVFLLFSAARVGRSISTQGTLEAESYPALAPGFRPYALRVGKLLGIAVLGALLSAVALMPNVNAILSSDRTVANAQLVFLPRAETIKDLFTILFGSNGMFALPLVCLLALFLRWRETASETRRKSILALLWLALLVIPATSSLMNGFSYETPRWYFVVIFAVATALPHWLAELEAGHGRVHPAGIVALCGGLTGLYLALGDHTLSLAGITWGVSFFVSLIAVLWVAFQKELCKRPLIARTWAALLCACVALCGVLNSLGVRVHNLYADAAQEAFFGTEQARIANFALAGEQDEFFRVHDMGIDTHEQDAETRPFVYGTHGISNYASELNGRLSTWHKKTFRFRTTPICAGIYQSFDNRLFHDVAWNVRFKVPAEGQEALLPEVWAQEQTGAGGTVYECAVSTGFELWYDTAIPESDWLAMGVAERDALLLQTATLEDDLAHRYPAPSLDRVSEYLSQTMADVTLVGALWTGDGMLQVDEQATLTWEVTKAQGDGEYLLCFSIAETSGQETFSISANGRTLDKFADTLAAESLNYPLTDYAFRYPGSDTELTMTLTKGTYRLWDVSISFNSYEKLSDWADARNRYDFTTLTVDGSRIDGTIAVEESGILALSMPTQPGWRCTVDGQRVELLTVNGIFAGIALEPGEHTIALRYTPPYLILGVCVTFATGLGIAGWTAICARKRKSAASGK